MLCAGPQLRSCEFNVACRTPTAILRVQCGVPDPNRDPASSVWRAGPQLWSREFSVVYRTSTAIRRVQCGAPDPNCDYANSVWRAGPQLWWKGLVVVAERVCQRSSCKMPQDKSDRMSEDMFARSSERMCQKECGWSHRWCKDIVLCGTDACLFQNWFEDRRGEREDWSDSLAVSTFAWHAALTVRKAWLWMEVCWLICVVLVAWRMMTGGSPYMLCWRVPANWKISFYWAWLTKWKIFYAEGPCLSSRIDWQVGSQRCFHVGALAELASVWLSANFLTPYSAFGFNRLSAERSIGIRDGWTLWRFTDMFDAFCLCYWYVDRWYPDMVGQVWCRECCIVIWACVVAATRFWLSFRRSTAMFDAYLFIYVWQVVSWHNLAYLESCCLKHFWKTVCRHVLASLISENVLGGLLPCFGMFIWACFGMFVSAMVLFCLLERIWQVLYWVEDRTRQNHAKM